MMSPLRSWLKRNVSAVVLALCTLLAAATEATADELQPDHPRRHVRGDAFVRGTLHVAGGSEQSARKYYRDIAAPQMKFETTETIEGSSIKNLLAYFGYPDVNARDLHQLSSDQLMELGSAGDILATAFFAPKISRVDTPPPATPSAFGWRKLIRFKAKAGSAAQSNGMELLYFLQNVFEKSPTGNPFDADKNVSVFNQAIATRKVGSGPYSPQKRALYFFAYGPLVKCDQAGTPSTCRLNDVPIKVGGQFQDDGAIGFGLVASFDARNPETEAPGKDFFYVPRSCEDCHGKSITNGKVNYLDTDHWFDRVKPSFGLPDAKFSQEDFTALSQLEALSPPRHGILYDGGPDLTTPQFKQAFDVIRKTQRGDQSAEFGRRGQSGHRRRGELPAQGRYQVAGAARSDTRRRGQACAALSAGFRAAAVEPGEPAGPHHSLLPRPLLLPVPQLHQIQRFRARGGAEEKRRHRGARHRASGRNHLDAAGSHVPRPDADGGCDGSDRRPPAVPRSPAATAMTGSGHGR